MKVLAVTVLFFLALLFLGAVFSGEVDNTPPKSDTVVTETTEPKEK